MDHLTDDDYMQICLERDRLLASDMFMRAPVMAKLLRYLVEQKLNDSDQDIKSYSIAVEALGRSSDFDSGADSYPRVQVGRLRKLMNQFYAEHPSATRLTVPVGVYRILLERTAGPAQSGDSVILPSTYIPDTAMQPGSHPDQLPVPQDGRELLPAEPAVQAALRPSVSELAERNRVQIAAIKNRQTVFMLFITLLVLCAGIFWAISSFAAETADRAATGAGVFA